MDRGHTPYNKGRQGHVRNVNPYVLYRQKMKRWKYPFIALGMFLMFLISFQVTGDMFKADVISGVSKDSFLFTKENLAFGKKQLAVYTKSLVDACESVNEKDCVKEGQALIRAISIAKTPYEAQTLLAAVEFFDGTWKPVVENKK